jgi:hypothetical protein
MREKQRARQWHDRDFFGELRFLPRLHLSNIYAQRVPRDASEPVTLVQ